jgi:YNFM family putative membrane transporter
VHYRVYGLRFLLNHGDMLGVKGGDGIIGAIGPMQLGFVYFVFLPSVATTLLAGRAVHRWGTRPTLWASLALASVGLPLVLLPNLTLVLLGMVLIGVGTFFAQATATGFVSQAATADRGAASGTAILGQIFDWIGWPACVGGIALSLGLAALLALWLKMTPYHYRPTWESDPSRLTDAIHIEDMASKDQEH